MTYYEKNKKYLLEKSKKYYEDNKENIKERMKEYNKIYWLENKEKILELRRTKYNNKIKNYYLSNKYNLLEKSRIYYENNKKYKLENTKENYYLKVLHLTELAAASARFWSWSLRAHEEEGTRQQIHGIPRGAAMDQQRQQKEADIDGAKTAGGAEPGGASAWHLKTQESG